ncbi:MAG TPA: RimK family alpha-L-glutamate ligase [Pirellulaceae bacterium]|jgi:ribosomal protein S6--L-glutamate ligase|nr:RimK family alpha-L-glutamate ligase [Pirellulaceae bacterium]
MRLGIVGDPEGYYVRELLRASGGAATVIAWNELAGHEVGGGEPRFRAATATLDAFDALIVRSMPAGSLEQVIFRMDVLGRLDAAGVVVLNPPRSLETAIDKYLTTARLSEAGIPTPRTVVVQTVDAAMQAFETLGRDVILKPLFGSEGKGIGRLTDPDVAFRTFRLLERLGSALYLQEYVDHPGFDLRILLVGDEAFAVRRRHDSDWRTNLSRGAVAEAVAPSPEELQLAQRAAHVVGAPLAGIDILQDREGRRFVLEANAVPGWKGVATAYGIDVAAKTIALAERLVEERRKRPAESPTT